MAWRRFSLGAFTEITYSPRKLSCMYLSDVFSKEGIRNRTSSDYSRLYDDATTVDVSASDAASEKSMTERVGQCRGYGLAWQRGRAPTRG